LHVGVVDDDDAAALVEGLADVEVGVVADADKTTLVERDLDVVAVDALRDGSGVVLAQGVGDGCDGSALRPLYVPAPLAGAAIPAPAVRGPSCSAAATRRRCAAGWRAGRTV